MLGSGRSPISRRSRLVKNVMPGGELKREFTRQPFSMIKRLRPACWASMPQASPVGPAPTIKTSTVSDLSLTISILPGDTAPEFKSNDGWDEHFVLRRDHPLQLDADRGRASANFPIREDDFPKFRGCFEGPE